MKPRERNSSDESEDDLPLKNLKRRILSDSSDDDMPLSKLRKCDYKEDLDLLEALLNKPTWMDMQFTPPDTTFRGTLEQPPNDGALKSPIEYFRDIVTDEVIEKVAEQTK